MSGTDRAPRGSKTNTPRDPPGKEEFGFDVVIRSLFEVPKWIEHQGGLWPEVEAGIAAAEKERRKAAPSPPGSTLRRLRFRWAVLPAISVLTAVLVIGLRLGRTRQPGPNAAASSRPASHRISVEYAEVEGKRARTHIFQTARRSYIYFTKRENGG